MPRRNYRHALRAVAAAWVALPHDPAEFALATIEQAREDFVRPHLHNAANMLDDAARLAAKGKRDEAALWRKVARAAIRQDRAFLAIHAALRDLRDGVDRPGILCSDIVKARPLLVLKRDAALPEARSLEQHAKTSDDAKDLRSHARWLRVMHKGMVVALALLDAIEKLDSDPKGSV